jgi:hypothetical protein
MGFAGTSFFFRTHIRTIDSNKSFFSYNYSLSFTLSSPRSFPRSHSPSHSLSHSLSLSLTASKHLDAVLPRLTAKLTIKPQKEEKRGFFSSKPAGPVAAGESQQATVALSYGFVCAYADTSTMCSRLDVHVLQQVCLFFYVSLSLSHTHTHTLKLADSSTMCSRLDVHVLQ